MSGVNGAAMPSAAWDAIASIRSTSPFSAGAPASGGSIADSLDALMPLVGTPATTPGNTTDLAILRQLQNAQQSTIDLFA
jgi:hypothetical protein